MSALNRKEAKAAARYVQQTGHKIENDKARQNLARFFAAENIFGTDDRDQLNQESYEARISRERTDDPIGVDSDRHQYMMPKNSVQQIMQERLESKAREVRLQDPQLVAREATIAGRATDTDDVNYRDPDFYNNTATHKAVLDNNLDEVIACISRGANLNIVNHDGLTPLGLAINENYIHIASHLRSAAAQQPAEASRPAARLKVA